MEPSQLVVELAIRWGDEQPRIQVRLNTTTTEIEIYHGAGAGLRSRLLAMIRPLLADLERLPETQPREDDLSDDTPF